MYPILPPELTDQVMDDLDKPSLCACSFVCRTWRISAQSRIFQDVTLTPACVDRFTRFLYTSPHIFSRVKDLQIDTLAEPDEEKKHRFIEGIIPLVAAKLDRVESFRLVDETYIEPFMVLSVPAVEVLVHSFPRLRVLSLSYIKFGDPRDLVALIAGHPHIEDITLLSVSWGIDSDDVSKRHWGPIFHDIRDSHLRMRSVVLESTHPDVFNLLGLHYASLSVDSLEYICPDEDHFHAMSRLQHVLGSSLQHLCIESMGAATPPAESTGNDAFLTQNTNLRTLCFDLFDNFLDYPLHLRVPAMISGISSLDLEEISFHSSLTEPECLSGLGLERIEDILIQPRFQKLKRIIFTLDVKPCHRQEMAEAILRRLPRLTERGLLTFYDTHHHYKNNIPFHPERRPAT